LCKQRKVAVIMGTTTWLVDQLPCVARMNLTWTMSSILFVHDILEVFLLLLICLEMDCSRGFVIGG
jgi:hypothetical protein